MSHTLLKTLNKKRNTFYTPFMWRLRFAGWMMVVTVSVMIPMFRLWWWFWRWQWRTTFRLWCWRTFLRRWIAGMLVRQNTTWRRRRYLLILICIDFERCYWRWFELSPSFDEFFYEIRIFVRYSYNSTIGERIFPFEFIFVACNWIKLGWKK